MCYDDDHDSLNRLKFQSQGHSFTERNTNFVIEVTTTCTGHQGYTNLNEMVLVIVATGILDLRSFHAKKPTTFRSLLMLPS
jgi:hypothetical protein